MITEFLTFEKRISRWYNLNKFWNLKSRSRKETLDTLKVLVDIQKLVDYSFVNDDDFYPESKYLKYSMNYIKHHVNLKNIKDLLIDRFDWEDNCEVRRLNFYAFEDFEIFQKIVKKFIEKTIP